MKQTYLVKIIGLGDFRFSTNVIGAKSSLAALAVAMREATKLTREPFLSISAVLVTDPR